jgi:hypothetical protein
MSAPLDPARKERTLRDAAILYAGAVEAEGPTRREWDALRKAAVRYAESEKRKGRPRTRETPCLRSSCS